MTNVPNVLIIQAVSVALVILVFRTTSTTRPFVSMSMSAKKEPCDKNAKCSNNLGSFSCVCEIGYEGDGISCSKGKTVLVLNYDYYDKNIIEPLLVDADGRSDTRIQISFGEETEVHDSCSVTYRNRFYVFGGFNQKRQISEVTLCELRKIGTLDFDHDRGACSNVDDRQIYLCFDFNHIRQCRSAVDPLGNFTEIAPSTHNHASISTAASPSKFQAIFLFL